MSAIRGRPSIDFRMKITRRKFVASLAAISASAPWRRALAQGFGFGWSASFGVVPPPLPGTPLAVYSMRNAVSGYAGNCVTVRRLSDNTTENIGFVGGVVDMATAITFAAGSALFVTEWFDQSGNGNNLTQSTNGAQPQLLLINGNPYVAFSYDESTYHVLTGSSAISLAGDLTIGLVCQMNTPASSIVLADYDGSNGFFLFLSGNSNGTGTEILASTGNVDDSTTNLLAGSIQRIAFTRASGTTALYINGTETASGTTSNSAASTPLAIGSYNGGSYPFEGLVGEAFVYSSALSGANLSLIDAAESSYFVPTGWQNYYNGSYALQFYGGATLTFGNVLQYEYTQAWTMFAQVHLYSLIGPYEAAIMGNIDHTDPNVTGYLVSVILSNTTFGSTTCGRLHILLSNNGTTLTCSLIGTTNLVDGKPHNVAVTYTGSGTAAGFLAYIDGNAETMTIQQDTLGGNTIKDADNNFAVGVQVNDPGNNLKGRVGFLQIDQIVRSQSYISTNFTPTSPPPNDATNTFLRLLMNAGSGTTVADTSQSGLTGILSNANMWVP